MIRWSATAPASTSNLGPGFDCLGLALRLPLTVTATRIPDGFRIERRGEGSDLALDPNRDALLSAYRRLFREAKRPVPTVALAIRSAIPVARGLGSSAAAITAGLVLANHWLRGRFPREELLGLAVELEGHPDNVSASLLGGLTLSMPRADGTTTSLALPAPRGLAMTLVIPEVRVSTEKARAMLPKTVPLAAAAANTARALGLLYAFDRKRPDLLADALLDVYHVPHRARLIPAYARVAEAGRRAGAYGVTISGSGPTLLALHRPGAGGRIGAAMVRAFARARVRARAIPGRIEPRGASARTLR
ncbi:MAG TPA: homoserine kinase [Candidatus Binatia bacterium]|nr:homoserine kinase [Candidatus Binatia bacterium]